MAFLHPEFLYFMLPPLFILFAFLLTQKEPNATFFSEDVLAKLRVSGNYLTLKSRNILFLLMAVCMVIALAAPVIPEGKVELKAKSADVMIALDISDSMLAQDLYPNRLELAKQKALELLHLAPNERIGVLAFAKNSYLVSPLSFDHDAVAFLLKKLNTDSITEKGTDFLSLLEVVDKQVKKESQKYLLIISDGGDSEDFSREIAFAKEQGITIFALSVATQNGAPIKLENGEFIKQNGEIIVSKRNPAFASLATKTGGVYVESINAAGDVRALLAEIDAHSEKKELKSEVIERYIPLFYFPLGMALLLLLIATSSMSKRSSVGLPSAFLLGLLFAGETPLNAGLLDFVELKKAKEAYEQGEYEKSAVLYEAYAKESKRTAAYYNAGNAYYKAQKYEAAREAYKKAAFDEKGAESAREANIGNAYAKEPTLENLKSAIEWYERSLKLQEESSVKENLEAMKKVLQEMQEEQKNEEKEQDKEEEQQEKSEQNQEEQDKEKQEQKESQESQKENGEKGDEKDEKQEKSEESEESQEQESDKELNEQDEEQNDEQNQTQTQNLEELKESDSEEDEKSAQTQPLQTQEMSESEEQKWLDRLGKESNTYMYKLSVPNELKKERSDEKPW